MAATTYGEAKIRFKNNEELVELLGSADENIRLWEELLDVKFRLKGDELIVSGEKAEVQRVAEALRKALREIAGIPFDERRDYLNRLLYPTVNGERSIAVSAAGKAIKAMTESQQIYIDKIFNNDITICIGPAGTGKTYLGVACGVNLLR
ncbi:MAG: PhoH family protein, partial [bacterium]